MKNRGERARLVDLLEVHGVPVPGFDGLRADAYEKHLARRSLAALDQFYGTLFTSSEVYEKIQSQCPAWGTDSRNPGKLPSVKTLTEIKERILVERRMADRAGMLQLIQQMARSLTGMPVSKQMVILQGVQALVAANLMEVVVGGKRTLDHLPAVDRVIRAASAQARGENMEARVRLDEKRMAIKKQEVALERERFEWERTGENDEIRNSNDETEEVEEEADWDELEIPKSKRQAPEKFQTQNQAVDVAAGADQINNEDTEGAKEGTDTVSEAGLTNGEKPAEKSAWPVVDNTIRYLDANGEPLEADEIRNSNDEIRKENEGAKAESETGVSPGTRWKNNENTEVTPDMRYVSPSQGACAGYPEGLGICNITQQTVDLATKRFLSPDWYKFGDGARRLSVLNRAKKTR
jgi:hypothetical protein